MGLLENTKLAKNKFLYFLINILLLYLEIKIFEYGGRYVRDFAFGMIIGLLLSIIYYSK